VKVALVGNPNCGKTTLFNRLTGSRGKVGNMPGVTVSATVASVRTVPGLELIDLPGTYSLHAKAPDEVLTREMLVQPGHPLRPDAVVLVLESATLRSGLFLAMQVLELGLPAVVVVNQTDATTVDAAALQAGLGGVPVTVVNAASDAREVLVSAVTGAARVAVPGWDVPAPGGGVRGWMARHGEAPAWATGEDREAVRAHAGGRSPAALQLEEASQRWHAVRALGDAVLPAATPEDADDLARRSRRTTRADRVLTHPVWGHAVLGAIFFVVFQAVFAWSAWPMDAVDQGFAALREVLSGAWPDTWWRSLVLDGVLAGIGGVVVFVPQIMILFGLIAVLEQSGYLARVGYLGDRFLEGVGLNGRSIVPLVGGMACAVPAVMAARSIPGKRERLLTILVTPLMTCSARLPVYAFLIAVLVPDVGLLGGLLNLRGLFLFGLYAVGTCAALLVAWLLHRGLPRRNEGGFTLEWPAYRWPRPLDVLREAFARGGAFVTGAGTVIVVASLVIWGLSSFGPPTPRAQITATVPAGPDRDAALLEASYLGAVARTIEPVFAPLGFDGKMGVAILTSFAAREVFVGTLAALYPSGEDGSIRALTTRLADEISPVTQRPVLNAASAASLLVFYIFALQCMSTVAIVQRELGSWTWAAAQWVAFTTFAYFAAWAVYVLTISVVG
jgi:ferrous iron transport protein B